MKGAIKVTEEHGSTAASGYPARSQRPRTLQQLKCDNHCTKEVQQLCLIGSSDIFPHTTDGTDQGARSNVIEQTDIGSEDDLKMMCITGTCVRRYTKSRSIPPIDRVTHES